MNNWQPIELKNDSLLLASQARRAQGRIRDVAQALAQFIDQHGMDALFVYKNKADRVYGEKNRYFHFEREDKALIKCRNKHELMSMPYILSDLVQPRRLANYKLFTADFYSARAIAVLDELLTSGPQRDLEKKLVFEHVKPCAVIFQALQDKGMCTAAELEAFLEQHLFVAVLTREENQIVNLTRGKNGKSCLHGMPNEAAYFSRYLEANQQCSNWQLLLFVPDAEHCTHLIQSQFAKLPRLG